MVIYKKFIFITGENNKKMKCIFSAVLGGIVTGQTVTAQFMIAQLKTKGYLIVNNQPEKSIFFPIKFIIYIFLTLYRFVSIRPDFSYVVINRTCASFYIRDLWIFLLSKLFADKLVIHVVGNDFPQYWKKIGIVGRKFYMWVLAGRVDFVVLGSTMERDLRTIFYKISRMHRFIMLPAIIDSHELQLCNKYSVKNALPSNKIRIGFMSNLIPEKGIFEYCQSILMLLNLDCRCEFWISGRRVDGVDYSLLDKLIEMNLVNYYEFISGEEKWQMLCSTDIFVLPTYYSSEFLPLSIIEAMVAGCVIVSCDCGAIADYVNENNGVLIEPKSATALTNSLFKLVNNDLGLFDNTNIKHEIIHDLDVF